MPSPGISKRNIVGVAILVFSVLIGTAATSQAATLTIVFSGNVNLALMGGPVNSTYSGFFTWDPATAPSQVESHATFYAPVSYQLILNGVDRTLPPGSSALVVGNDGSLNGGPGDNDALLFLAGLDNDVTIDGVFGDTLFVLGFVGDKTVWNSESLPTDYSFLSLLSTRFSAVSLEVTGEGDDVMVGEGRDFVATPGAAVPEPATLTLTAPGLAAVVTRTRRRRQQP